MITFLDFQEEASEVSIIFLKRGQFIVKLRRQIKDEKKGGKNEEKIVNVYKEHLNNN